MKLEPEDQEIYDHEDLITDINQYMYKQEDFVQEYLMELAYQISEYFYDTDALSKLTNIQCKSIRNTIYGEVNDINTMNGNTYLKWKLMIGKEFRMNLQKFGKRLRHLRMQKNMSHNELKDATNVSVNTLKRLEEEDNESPPRSSTLKSLEQYFGDELYNEANDEPVQTYVRICIRCGSHFRTTNGLDDFCDTSCRDSHFKAKDDNTGVVLDNPPSPSPPAIPGNIPTANAGNNDFMAQLMSGELLSKLQAQTDKFTGLSTKMDNIAEKFSSADLKIVKEAVAQLLKEEKPEDIPMIPIIFDEVTARHFNSPLLSAVIRCRIPAWIYGDSGSSKSTTAEMIAKDLKLKFDCLSVCPTSTKSEFMGYKNAMGDYVSTPFRDIYENGGVFLIDEIDNGNPSVLSVLNTALSNNKCSFPDKFIVKHEDCVILAAANTIGRGATIEFVGRNAIDAATLDRFAYIQWNIDEKLEEAILGMDWKYNLANIEDGGVPTDDSWLATVRKARENCLETKLHHIISPRAAIYGQKLSKAGVGRDHLKEMLIYKGLKEADRKKINI